MISIHFEAVSLKQLLVLSNLSPWKLDHESSMILALRNAPGTSALFNPHP